MRTPVIISLLVLSFLLLGISFITHEERVGEDSLEISVPPMTMNHTVPLDAHGIVVAHAEVPEGVKIYLLTEQDLLLYRETGELPSTYLGDGVEEITVENPCCLLVQNGLNEEVDVVVEIDVYRRVKPYSLLAIPSFILTLVATSLVMMKLIAYGAGMGAQKIGAVPTSGLGHVPAGHVPTGLDLYEGRLLLPALPR